MPTQFFDLPRELRDKVYQLLWFSTPHINLIYKTTIMLTAEYEKPFQRYLFKAYEPYMSPPRWLLTSKAFLKEGVEELNGKATITLRLRNPGAEYVYSPHAILPPHMIKQLHILTHPMINDNDDEVNSGDNFDSSQPRAVIHWNLKSGDGPYLNSLLSSLAAAGQTKILRI